ncbi:MULTISPECIES: hypothetical protein [unclassified Anabaena]|uniref:hypothetical protein n=1 Tax=unclassified Anabaena TaxID=2619674 RepID=UPI001447A280|nr:MULTISPECIES: hypothetical protein [unclassified Anabaena]MTJ09354.1 hypothetical protein [Anabaena sp. UHCC 0204]MTJ55565.1 hypothetical protein [Anabaena sp. UHCC 0253]
MPKIKKIYRLEEYSLQNILYHSIAPLMAILFILSGDWVSACFCLLTGLLISLLWLDIDNCHEVLTCNFNSSLRCITLKQRNSFSHGVLEFPLDEIETVLIKSRNSTFNVKTRFGKNVQIDNQFYWIVIVLNSGKSQRLTYYETTLFSCKQQMVDHITFLKDNS